MFHNDLEKEVPYIKRITSLINVRDTYGRDDELIVGELLVKMRGLPCPATSAKKKIERL